MGCCTSTPHNARVYRDPGDLDEVEVEPFRYFGTNRAGSNLVPDDVGGLPSTHYEKYLAFNSDTLLYEAEIDHGYGFRCCRPFWWLLLLPGAIPAFIAVVATQGLGQFCKYLSCDQACCWLRKEYSTRTFFRVYPNRIVVNYPSARFPFGYLGCGSWNADAIMSHPFDRGAFGFSRVHCFTLKHLCCICPVYGGTVARHRCQCNGPLWNRMFSDCGGWWCDEWICKSWFCVYPYGGLAYPDEVAFACSIALQAYFEGRSISREEMDRCVEFWRENISEVEDLSRRREACCEPVAVPCCSAELLQKCCHPKRTIPYADDEVTDQTREVYAKYGEEREKQIARYEKISDAQYSTICRSMGCRRVFGRHGFIFCTEGCDQCGRKAGEPAPFPEVHEFDDDYDASMVLMKVIGPPPPNIVIKRWKWDPEKNEPFLDTHPKEEAMVERSMIDQAEQEKPDEKETDKIHES